MSVNIVTGLTGKSHVTSAQDGRKNAFAFGSGRYVFDSGSKFAYELVSNNLIKILDGDLIDQGRHICTDQNDYTELTIDNGISGNNRKDLIVMRYQKNADTSIESASLVVIKGTSTSGVASDPDYTEGDILSGDLVDDFPLYRVNLTGLSITSVDQLFEILPVGGIHGILSQISALNTNLIHTKRTSSVWWSPIITVLSAWLLVDDVNKTAELCADVTFTPTSAGKLDMCSIPSDIVPITPTNGHGYPIINNARGTIIIGTLIGRVLSVDIPQSYVNVYQSLSISIRFMYSSPNDN